MYSLFAFLDRLEQWRLSLLRKDNRWRYPYLITLLFAIVMATAMGVALRMWGLVLVLAFLGVLLLLELQPIDRFAPNRSLSAAGRRTVGGLFLTSQVLALLAYRGVGWGALLGVVLVSVYWMWPYIQKRRETGGTRSGPAD